MNAPDERKRTNDEDEDVDVDEEEDQEEEDEDVDSLDTEESEAAFKEAETMEEFLKLWSRFYDNKIMIPTCGALFINSEGDNPQADAVLAEKFKALTAKGLICTTCQVMIPFQQKAYLGLYCPRDNVSLFCSELNRFEDIVAFWHSSPPFDDCLENLYVTYGSPSSAIPLAGRKMHQSKMTGRAITRLGAGCSELGLISEWLSDEMQDLFNPGTHVYVNITSPSFKTDPLYIFDVANQAWDVVVVFLEFGNLVRVGSVEEIRNYLKLHGEEMDLEGSIDGEEALHELVLTSARSLEEKHAILVLLLDNGLFSVTAYEWVAHPDNISLEDTEKSYFQQLLVPYLPRYYDPMKILRRFKRQK